MEPFLGHSEIVIRLEVDPALSVGAKKPGEPQGGVSGYRTLAAQISSIRRWGTPMDFANR